MSASFPSSVVGTISDLDGFSIAGDYHNFLPVQHNVYTAGDDFGFDPPVKPTHPPRMNQTYSPPEDNESYDDFEFDPIKDESLSVRAMELDRLVALNTSNNTGAIARFGQVTPPRSNSESSIEKSSEQKQTRQRRTLKTMIKDEQTQQNPVGRKRRNTRKNSTATTANPEEDEKRKQSLEKNRLAAAKCRVNKKEKTEHLQRDSHDKAVQNAFLKEQVMRMKEEVQQMNALLLAHANCEGCKSPEDIQKHLSNLGNEYFTHHMQDVAHQFPGFANMPYDGIEMDQDHYFSPDTDSSMMNPPLPEFDREQDFSVTTPMHND